MRPAAGRLLWDGEDALADLPAHGRRVAYLGHLDAVKPGLTVAENLRFAAAMAAASVDDALEALGLATLADLPARMLSAGQKRRLALSRLALSHRAAVAAGRADAWAWTRPRIERFGAVLRAHRARGGMVVAATHLPLPLAGVAELRLG